MAADQDIERVLLEVRTDLLREVLKRESSIDLLYRHKVLKLQRILQEGEGLGPEVLNREIEALIFEVRPIIEKLIETGALSGNKAAQKTFLKVFGAEARAALVAEYEVLDQAGAQIRGETTVGHLNLSERLWGETAPILDKLVVKIEQAIRARKSLSEIGNQILGVKAPEELDLAEYIRELLEAADEGGDEFEAAVTKHKRRIERLGSAAGPDFTIKPAVKRLIKDVREALPKQISKHVQTYIGEKAKYHATVVARSETIEAYKAGYRRSVEGQPWLKGYHWSLGNRHPEYDECDILAGQNLYGLGEGGYPVDSLPDTPHPNDMCVQIAIIDKDHFKRRVAKKEKKPEPPKPWLKGERETSEQWLRKQDPETQRKILGPTRYKIFKDSQGFANAGGLLAEDGVPLKVSEVVRRYDHWNKAALGRGFTTDPQGYVKLRGESRKAVELSRKKLGPVEIKTSYEAAATWGGGKPVLKTGMSIEQAEKAICNQPIEHCYILDKNGNTVARLSSGHEDKVRPTPKEETAIRSRVPATPIVDLDLKGKDYREPGAPYVYTHNHPPLIENNMRFDYAALSPGDFKEGRAWNVHELRSVNPHKDRGARFVVTDERKWQEATTRRSRSPVFQEIEDAHERTKQTGFLRYLKDREQPDNKGYNAWMQRRLVKLYNDIGKKYGFKYELFTRK